MDNKECEICSKMTKEKYKHYNLWKTLAIVFICLTALLAVLYFASGSLFTSRTIKYDNDVVIENDGDNNTNKNNGNIIIEKQNDSTGAAIIISVLILSGGILGGCYIISSRNNNHQKQGNDKE